MDAISIKMTNAKYLSGIAFMEPLTVFFLKGLQLGWYFWNEIKQNIRFKG